MTLISDLTVAQLEARLQDLDAGVRTAALAELLARQESLSLPPEAEVANMHCHTFYSFNAYGHSPTSLAWLARKQGFRLLGIVDFDVLDGVDEFLDACDLAGVRGSAGIETRVFIPEFATREINSPGEPGVYYHMGIGFTGSAVPAEVADILADLRQRADQRNRTMVQKVNAYLNPVTVDYETDILPLTPAGNPTERHLVLAYRQAAERQFDNPADFWAGRLDMPRDHIAALLADSPQFQNVVRSKLMKKDGVGYVQPDAGSFPSIAPFHQLITACGALPCATWLDGTSPGEQAMPELLDLLMSQGVVALNIVPDRNWNIKDSATRQIKVENLYWVVELAQELALPLNIGTEMNSYGQKLVDDFDAPELAPVRGTFLDGAYFIYGHTALQRSAGLGYQSAWAASYLPERQARNTFYTRVGRLLPPERAATLGLTDALSPDEILTKLDR